MTRSPPPITRLWLADDLRADSIEYLAALINAVYDIAESGMWHRKGVRTNAAEVERLLQAHRLILAEADGGLVGAVRVGQLDGGTAEFGMLVVDERYRGQGIGAALVAHAERWARERQCLTMRLELLTPRHWTHPVKAFLRDWYTRLGYVPRSTEPFEAHFPEAGAELATECDFTVWEKALSASPPGSGRRMPI